MKARGAPATAAHVRDIVKQVSVFAILHGEKVDNPADDVGAASVATFVLKDCALSPLEIRLMARQMESVPIPSNKGAQACQRSFHGHQGPHVLHANHA